MRVISGKWGGRKLVSFTSNAIRPTTDRVKETIFNMIGPDIVETRVLDLFSGTGSLGLEALSRGASEVTAVDSGNDASKVITRNCDLLGAGAEHKFVSRDVLVFIEKCEASYDYILIDPPFTKKMGASVVRKVAENQNIFNEDTRIFIEYVKGEEIYDDPEGALELAKTKNYGDKLLCVYHIKES